MVLGMVPLCSQNRDGHMTLLLMRVSACGLKCLDTVEVNVN